MIKDIIIQYCGPYSIQTSDAAIVARSIDSSSIVVERERLENLERPTMVEEPERPAVNLRIIK